MFRRLLLAATVVMALLAPALVATDQPATASLSGISGQPVRILTIGDSITAGGGWQAELCRLMDQDAGVACDIRNAAVAGTACSYWPSRITSLLVTHQPDVVVLMCGTNDDVNAWIYGEPLTSWSWRATTEAIRVWNPSTVVASGFIQYSDPKTAPQWVLDSEPITNDRIYVEYMRCPSCYVLLDWQSIPATATYLVSTPEDPYGLHSTPRGQKYQGRLTYDRLAPRMGWPASSEPALCDLYGHRTGLVPRPTYTPC